MNLSNKLLIPRKGYPNNFDVIRLLLAVSVIFCHSYVVYYGPDIFPKKEPFLIWSRGQISMGSTAVDLFFIISGFLIVKSFESSSGLVNYLTKRVLRIYPAFVTAALTSLLVAGFIGTGLAFNRGNYSHYISQLYLREEAIRIATLQPPFQYLFFEKLPQPGLNLSLWTIQFEFACYLLVPLLARAGIFRKRSWLLVAFFTAYLVLLLQQLGYIFPYKDKLHLWYGNPFFYPRFVTYFLAGACCYFYRDKIIRSRWLMIAAVAAMVFCFAIVKCVDQVMPVAGTYLLFFTAFNPRIKLQHFARHGDFSYGVYLYAWPVQQSVMFFLHSYLNPYRLFFIALAITMVLAFCSWHLIEKPFLKLKKKNIAPVIPLPVSV